jgi:hypothetical protein
VVGIQRSNHENRGALPCLSGIQNENLKGSLAVSKVTHACPLSFAPSLPANNSIGKRPYNTQKLVILLKGISRSRPAWSTPRHFYALINVGIDVGGEKMSDEMDSLSNAPTVIRNPLGGNYQWIGCPPQCLALHIPFPAEEPLTTVLAR